MRLLYGKKTKKTTIINRLCCNSLSSDWTLRNRWRLHQLVIEQGALTLYLRHQYRMVDPAHGALDESYTPEDDSQEAHSVFSDEGSALRRPENGVRSALAHTLSQHVLSKCQSLTHPWANGLLHVPNVLSQWEQLCYSPVPPGPSVNPVQG